MARRGARVVSQRPRPGAGRDDGRRSPQPRPPPPWEPETWVEEPTGSAPDRRQQGGQPRQRRSGRLPASVLGELSASGGRTQARQLQQRLSDATAAYERDRYRDAARILRDLADVAPQSPSVRELYGLTLYRQGRWAAAIRQLTAYHRLTGSYDQHPVLADCYRALGNERALDETWDELRRASPSAEVVAEGRLVVAGARADRGDVRGALALLRRADHDIRRPRPHHVRQWYALADLYERSGDLPRARELFRRVLRHDAQLSDAAERLAALG